MNRVGKKAVVSPFTLNSNMKLGNLFVKGREKAAK